VPTADVGEGRVAGGLREREREVWGNGERKDRSPVE
jgi:hypothetical protein